MRTLALVAISLTLSFGSVSAQQRLVSTQQVYVCPKCGKVHVRSTNTTGGKRPSVRAGTTRQTVSYVRPVPTSLSASRSIVTADDSKQEISSSPSTDEAPIATTSNLQASGGVSNVLAELNAQRSRQGVPALRYDPELQLVAQRRAQHMASIGLKNHPPGSFAPGRYEGVGWSSSYSPSGVSACFTSDPRMRFAGAAMATGRDGVYFAVVYR